MLNKIIHYSLHNRLLVLCASILLLIAGSYTADAHGSNVFPDLNAPTVVIMTEANGMAAEEVEQLVTFPGGNSRRKTELPAYAVSVLLPPMVFLLSGWNSTGEQIFILPGRL